MSEAPTTPDELGEMLLALGGALKQTMPDDVAFVLLLGIKGKGTHKAVSNLPSDTTRRWLADAATASTTARTEAPAAEQVMRAALQRIATGQIVGEPNNVAHTVAVVRQIAKEALDLCPGKAPTHCDDAIEDERYPMALRAFLEHARAPAVDQIGKTRPVCWATYKGAPVLLTMASRLGDIGISAAGRAHGYDERVPIDELTDFRTTKERAA